MTNRIEVNAGDRMPTVALAMMIGNWILPAELPAEMPGKGDLAQYLRWPARWRPRRGWRRRGIEQCSAIAVMDVAAVLLNWKMTIGDHLLHTPGDRYGPVAGVDLFMLRAALAARSH